MFREVLQKSKQFINSHESKSYFLVLSFVKYVKGIQNQNAEMKQTEVCEVTEPPLLSHISWSFILTVGSPPTVGAFNQKASPFYTQIQPMTFFLNAHLYEAGLHLLQAFLSQEHPPRAFKKQCLCLPIGISNSAYLEVQERRSLTCLFHGG